MPPPVLAEPTAARPSAPPRKALLEKRGLRWLSFPAADPIRLALQSLGSWKPLLPSRLAPEEERRKIKLPKVWNPEPSFFVLQSFEPKKTMRFERKAFLVK
jgi:hypothetical protein